MQLDLKKNLLPAIVLLIAEAIIITVMLKIPYAIPTRVRILDMVVLSIILWTAGFDFFRPLVKLDDKHPTGVGSLGVRWTFLILYIIGAVWFGVFAIGAEISFFYQLLVQCALFGFLMLGWNMSYRTRKIVEKVGKQEDAMLAGRQEMRTSLRMLKDEVQLAGNMPEYFTTALDELEEKLRYIAPCDNPEAIAYEKQFADIAGRIQIALTNFQMNEDSIRQDLKRLEIIIGHRKNTYR
jgi:hypothetical protein